MSYLYSLATGSLLTGLLLSSCSQPAPTTDASSAATTNKVPVASVKHFTGMKVDSLNGIPGHHFGEALTAFPGLILGETNMTGMKRYYYPSGRSTHGWFGKHDTQLTTNYYFVNDKFAYFVATAYRNNLSLLSDEATYLFGKGDLFELDGVIWQGKQARAVYTKHFSSSGPYVQLEVVSELLETQRKQQAAARLKAENAN
ncbi:MAG: hypothetical protein ACRYFV_05835 [Janthinobacterium lividum]